MVPGLRDRLVSHPAEYRSFLGQLWKHTHMCVCFHSPTHMCSCMHSCFTHAGIKHIQRRGSHRGKHITHTQPDVHITVMKITLELTC